MNFGEGNKMYGVSILNCADALRQGDFDGAIDAIQSYRDWRRANH